MTNVIESKTETPNTFPQVVTVRSHTFRADVAADSGGTDSAPGPHDYFDAALTSCKALTATWYARQKGYPLERVEVHVTRDDREERKGTYRLAVRVELFGPLTDDQRRSIQAAVAKCPVHKLMTTTEVIIETEPPRAG